MPKCSDSLSLNITPASS